MLWFLLTLLATLNLALFNISSKIILTRTRVAPAVYGSFMQIAVGLISLLLIVSSGFQAKITLLSLSLTLLVAVLYAAAAVAYYTALKHLEVSRLTVIISLETIFTQLTAFFLLQEPLTTLKVVAAVLIVTAVGLVTLTRQTLAVSFSRYDLLALSNAAVYSFTALIDKYLVTNFYAPTTYQPINFILPGLLMVAALTAAGSGGRWAAEAVLLLRQPKIITAAVLTFFLSYFLIFKVYTLGGDVSRVTPLLTTQTVLIVALEFFLLQDRQNLARKILASLLAVGGAFLMKA